MPTAVPLILTAALAPADQARFDALRERHFPAHLNYIAAHLTLFHHLPGTALEEVDAALAVLAANQVACAADVTGVRSLGRGVAFSLACPALAAARKQMVAAFHDRLTAQDRQGWRPHITVQNKVMPAQATALLAALDSTFEAFQVSVTGLALWHYRGGPWEPAAAYPFRTV